jgi:hypothetical protein
MTDPVVITTLIVSAANIIIIPILIKTIDVIFYFVKHVKNSSCCFSKIEMQTEKDETEKEEIIKK